MMPAGEFVDYMCFGGSELSCIVWLGSALLHLVLLLQLLHYHRLV